DDPSANGASLHLYSATDDFCVVLPSGAGWKRKKSTWRYRNKGTKSSALVKDGRLDVTIASDDHQRARRRIRAAVRHQTLRDGSAIDRRSGRRQHGGPARRVRLLDGTERLRKEHLTQFDRRARHTG